MCLTVSERNEWIMNSRATIWLTEALNTAYQADRPLLQATRRTPKIPILVSFGTRLANPLAQPGISVRKKFKKMAFRR